MRTTKPRPLDLDALQSEVSSVYWNEPLAEVNDHAIRMSVMTYPFGWHVHPDSDETFLVLDGELVITFDGGEVVLGPGKMLTVPKGVRHRTRPRGKRSVNLTFERSGAETIFDPVVRGTSPAG